VRERERERERAICFSTSRGEEIVLAEGLDPRMKNEKRKENGKERVFRDYKTKKDTAKERRKAEAEALNRLRELFPNSKPMELIKVLASSDMDVQKAADALVDGKQKAKQLLRQWHVVGEVPTATTTTREKKRGIEKESTRTKKESRIPAVDVVSRFSGGSGSRNGNGSNAGASSDSAAGRDWEGLFRSLVSASVETVFSDNNSEDLEQELDATHKRKELLRNLSRQVEEREVKLQREIKLQRCKEAFEGLHGILRHREKKLRKEIDDQEDADVEFSDLEALRKLLGSFGQVVVSPKASSSDEDDSRSDQSDTFPALGNGNNNLRAFLQHNSSDKNGTKWSNLV